jgi:glycosyltransferase involved in cell wall biosynthesis
MPKTYMRVLQVSKYYPPFFGGIEQVVYDLTEGLNQSGVVCDVLSVNHELFRLKIERGDYRVIRSVSLGTMFSTAMSFDFICWYRKMASKYDVVHMHLPNPLANIAEFLFPAKSKLVLHWHSDIIRQRKLLKIYRPFQEWILKRADRIIATSPKYARESPVINRFLSKTRSVAIGLNTDKFCLKKELVKRIRKRYSDKHIVFSVGRLIYYKGFSCLIEAAKKTADDTVFLIGGTGKLENQLAGLIRRLGLDNKVFLLGRIPGGELAAYYHAADVVCMPSIAKSEAFGVVQIEAMSFGKPVVSTDIEGSSVSWVNQDNVSGLVVPPKNAEALAVALKKLLNNKDLYSRLAKGAKRRFQRLFTAEEMVNSTLDVYRDLMPE